MSNFHAKLASAVLIGVAANVCVMASSGGAARAADNCLTEPKEETAQGQHWYYRIERGTGRHCWYMRGENDAPARNSSVEPVAAAKPAPPTTGNAPPRSLADARAELPPRTRVEDNAGAAPPPSVWPDPPALAAGTTGIGPGVGMSPSAPVDSQITSRWPQASGAPSSASPAPEASLMVADAQAQPDETVTTPPPAAQLQASPPLMRDVGSLQKLILVAFGALALAGIAGSTVYRLAGARNRRRREQRWPQKKTVSTPVVEHDGGAPWIAPELNPTVPYIDAAADEEDVAVHRIKPGNSDDSFEKIEDFLARLTTQLQDELQSKHATEIENPHPHH